MFDMEVVFLRNLLEAAKGLKENEILFSPMGRWAKSYIKEIGGVVEDNERLNSLTDSDFGLSIGNFRIFGYHDVHRHEIDDRFLLVFRDGLVVTSWGELFEGINKSGGYLRNNILRGAKSIEVLKNYDLFVYKNIESWKERRFIKSMVAGEVSEKLVKKEIGKRKYYLKAIGEVVGKTLQELKFAVHIPLLAIEKGVEGVVEYLKSGEYELEGKKILAIFSTGIFERGVEVETRIKVDYEEDKVYLAFGKVYDESTRKNYLLGVPIFKGKVSQLSSVFRLYFLNPRTENDQVLEIRKRKEPRSGKGNIYAELRTNSFEARILCAEKPSVIGLKTSLVTVDDSHAKVIQLEAIEREESKDALEREGSEEAMKSGIKLCNIEIGEDGKFHVNTEYDNVINVSIRTIKGDTGGAKEVEELKRLIEGKKFTIKGRIVKELSYIEEGKIFLKLEGVENLDKVDEHIAFSLYKFAKEIVRDTSGNEFPLDLSKEDNKGKRLIEIILTGFVQKTLESFRKVVDLCFELEGTRHLFKTHDMEYIEKVAYDQAILATGIDAEGLKGKKKSIVEVLKLISHSYPLMDHLNMKRFLKELKDITSAVFSAKKVPLDEIGVLIEKINPEYMRLPNGYVSGVPSSSALFLVEGDNIRVYTKGYAYDSHNYPNVRELSMGIGDIQITVYNE